MPSVASHDVMIKVGRRKQFTTSVLGCHFNVEGKMGTATSNDARSPSFGIIAEAWPGLAGRPAGERAGRPTYFSKCVILCTACQARRCGSCGRPNCRMTLPAYLDASSSCPRASVPCSFLLFFALSNAVSPPLSFAFPSAPAFRRAVITIEFGLPAAARISAV